MEIARLCMWMWTRSVWSSANPQPLSVPTREVDRANWSDRSLRLIPLRYRFVASCIGLILTRFYPPATAAPSISIKQKGIGPLPNQLCAGLHAHVLHHPQIDSALIIQALPLRQEWIISIGKESVIELVIELLFQGPKTGKVDDKSVGIKLLSCKPKGKTAAIAMHESTVSRMTPLTMAAGISSKILATSVSIFECFSHSRSSRELLQLEWFLRWWVESDFDVVNQSKWLYWSSLSDE